MFFPSDWQQHGRVAELQLYELPQKQDSCVAPRLVETIQIPRPLQIPSAPQVDDSCGRARLDNDDDDPSPTSGIKHFWSLQDGPYQIRVGVKLVDVRESTLGIPYRSAEGELLDDYWTIPFREDDVMLALGRRLDRLSRELTGLDYFTWLRFYREDKGTAKRYLWRQTYKRAQGYYASVDVSNQFGEREQIDGELMINALLANGSKVTVGSTVKLSLGKAIQASTRMLLPGQTERVDFGPFNLDEESDQERSVAAAAPRIRSRRASAGTGSAGQRHARSGRRIRGSHRTARAGNAQHAGSGRP